jgi:hypothetical protein
LNIQITVPTHLNESDEPYTECDFKLLNPETGKYFGEEMSVLIILKKGFAAPKTELDIRSIMEEANSPCESSGNEEMSIDGSAIYENALNLVNFVDN